MRAERLMWSVSVVPLATALFAAASAAAAAEPAEPKFTKKPTAEKAGDKVRIEFAMDHATDVAVYIEDAKGKIVRHLVAGVLGKNPPEPLSKPTAEAQAHLVYRVKAPAEIQGAEWTRFGFSPYSMHSGSDTCMCEGAGFDIDLLGRVFYPNLGQFRVEVVDAANNLIGTFGKYGNQDSGGKDARVKTPAIPLAWPLNVVASDTHAYVADTINRRVVKVKLAYAVEAVCAVK